MFYPLQKIEKIKIPQSTSPVKWKNGGRKSNCTHGHILYWSCLWAGIALLFFLGAHKHTPSKSCLIAQQCSSSSSKVHRKEVKKICKKRRKVDANWKNSPSQSSWLTSRTLPSQTTNSSSSFPVAKTGKLSISTHSSFPLLELTQ